MKKYFNVTGACYPDKHYMVDITSRLIQIKEMVDRGDYFAVNRGRQYGKTTTLKALANYLKDDYTVLHLDFQKLDGDDFETRKTFVRAFARELWQKCHLIMNDDVSEQIKAMKQCLDNGLADLFSVLNGWCETLDDKPAVLIIDEVDYASNNQVFIDFLARLRSDYLDRDNTKTFQSVILAGVYDVKNIKRKIRPDEENKVNSPWNIAADFKVDMSFSKDEIFGMLSDYEADNKTGMDKELIAQMLSDSTSGYPFLVSRLCQIIDREIAGSEEFPDKVSAWTKEGFIAAEKQLVHEKNTLFDSLTGKLIEYPYLKDLISAILFEGRTISYVFSNPGIEVASMLGFVKNANNYVAVSNRIFEMVLYDHLLSEEELNNAAYAAALSEKKYFIKNGKLDMKLVLERFVLAFSELYSDKDDKFKEEIGRKYFMLFLKPIINGTGHSYIEARTRDLKRTDIVVDYHGEQYIIELKIWHGSKYHADGEKQIAEYLDFYGLKKGYMLTFNFNKKKVIGVAEKQYGEHIIVEATV